MSQKSVIYAIVNKVNNKVYVGSTRNFSKRKRTHLNYFEKGKHHNPYLQRAWDKYGREAFEFKILMYVLNIEEAQIYEQYWISEMMSNLPEYGYNLMSAVLNCPGRSAEVRQKMSERMKGRKHTPEWDRKIGEAKKGKPLSDETKEKIGKARRGKRDSLSVRKKKSEAMKGENNPFYGKKHTEETRKRISETHKGLLVGERNPMFGKNHTPEAIRKMSETRKGKSLSEEQKQKLSKAFSGSRNPFYGKVHPPDIQAKILETRRRNQAKYVEDIQLTFL